MCEGNVYRSFRLVVLLLNWPNDTSIAVRSKPTLPDFTMRKEMIPEMMYSDVALYQLVIMTQAQRTTITRDFTIIQKGSGCLISGAFRTTAAKALNGK